MLRKALIGAVLLVVAWAGPAAAQYNPIVVNPSTVEAGGTITVSGKACPNETFVVTVRKYDPANPGPDVRATDPGPVGSGEPIVSQQVTSDAQGNFSVTLTIPAGTPPGQYVVETTSDCTQSKVINVVESSQGGQGTGGGNLSRTGSDIDKMGLAGAGLLVLGGLILVATKRRRHEATPAV